MHTAPGHLIRNSLSCPVQSWDVKSTRDLFFLEGGGGGGGGMGGGGNAV